MRRAAKIDANQPEIVEAFRKAGCSVTPTHAAGKGFPDLCVGYRGKTYLCEIKDGSLSWSRRVLTDAQVEWFDNWRGHAVVVETVEEALAMVKEWGE